MRSGIEQLKRTIDSSADLVGRAENAGMEMSDQQLELREARNHLTLARTEMHTFDPRAVETVLKGGLEITGKVDKSGQAALEELRFRKTGLAISVAAILIVVIALGLKVRQLDRNAGLKG